MVLIISDNLYNQWFQKFEFDRTFFLWLCIIKLCNYILKKKCNEMRFLPDKFTSLAISFHAFSVYSFLEYSWRVWLYSTGCFSTSPTNFTLNTSMVSKTQLTRFKRHDRFFPFSTVRVSPASSSNLSRFDSKTPRWGIPIHLHRKSSGGGIPSSSSLSRFVFLSPRERRALLFGHSPQKNKA